ncbi:MAG: hypothetical protein QG629_289 [Patescibacteria group bacterium]|nr:hypothetical protein [Candidatus Saccharibacteria bacterium]MDQ5963207.1 hypothetical protein [Patescibacteria group bacterium]
MNSFYLIEDLQQIQRYFPQAQPVALITPFDITEKPSHTSLREFDACLEEELYLVGRRVAA